MEENSSLQTVSKPILPAFKKCRHCQEELPTSLFHVDRSKRDGFRATCKNCKTEGRDKRAEQRVGMQKCSACGEYKPKTAEHFTIYTDGRAYRYCRPCTRERKRAWWQALPVEERRVKCFQSPEYKAEVKRRHWAKLKADPERLNAQRAQARKNMASAYKRDPQKFIIRGHADRARREQAPGDFSKHDLALKFREQSGKCIYCGCSVGAKQDAKWTVEHLIPLSRGGSNFPDNIAIACSTCNFSKRDKTPHEFMPERFAAPAK